jgi:hypothetical protein
MTGTVTDKAGGVILGAQVIVADTAQQAHYTTTANGSGAYVTPGLPAGVYSVRISGPGFGSYVSEGIILRAAQKERVDSQLAIATMSAVVNVEAGSSTCFENSSAKVSGIVTTGNPGPV